jgi:precorrin-2/cobalt-factor-2 C20-methyltransferase
MSGTGKLYGVGVGPGDPELMTLKAARILASAPIVAYFHKTGKRGHARGIVEGRLATGVVELALAYPLTTEAAVGSNAYTCAMTEFYDQAAATLATHLTAGRHVAVLCEGDPFFYGSFMHLYHRLYREHLCEVVPGISGMSAAWTHAGTPITYGDDVLQVLPGTLPREVLKQRVREADALVIMKLGSNFAKVHDVLAETGLLGRAIYVERASMAGEIIQPLSEKADDAAPYFSMILVPGRGRCL